MTLVLSSPTLKVSLTPSPPHHSRLILQYKMVPFFHWFFQGIHHFSNPQYNFFCCSRLHCLYKTLICSSVVGSFTICSPLTVPGALITGRCSLPLWASQNAPNTGRLVYHLAKLSPEPKRPFSTASWLPIDQARCAYGLLMIGNTERPYSHYYRADLDLFPCNFHISTSSNMSASMARLLFLRFTCAQQHVLGG